MRKQLGNPEAWIWPVTAAIVMGGSILFWSIAGLFWLATHPRQPPVVLWMAPAAAHAQELTNIDELGAAISLENQLDDHAN